MKGAVFITLLILSFHCEAQNYFNKRYDYNGSWVEAGTSIYEDSGRIFVAMQTLYNDGIGDLRSAGVMELDSNGNFININLFPGPLSYTYAGGGGSLNRVADGFILGGSI